MKITEGTYWTQSSRPDQYSHDRGSTRRKEKEAKSLFKEVVAENFPHLRKEMHIQVQIQESYRIPNKKNLKISTPRHIIIKLPKVKDKEIILKAAVKK